MFSFPFLRSVAAWIHNVMQRQRKSAPIYALLIEMAIRLNICGVWLHWERVKICFPFIWLKVEPNEKQRMVDKEKSLKLFGFCLCNLPIETYVAISKFTTQPSDSNRKYFIQKEVKWLIHLGANVELSDSFYDHFSERKCCKCIRNKLHTGERMF